MAKRGGRKGGKRRAKRGARKGARSSTAKRGAARGKLKVQLNPHVGLEFSDYGSARGFTFRSKAFLKKNAPLPTIKKLQREPAVVTPVVQVPLEHIQKGQLEALVKMASKKPAAKKGGKGRKGKK